MVNDIINDRLKSALSKEEAVQIQVVEEVVPTVEAAKGGTEFTEEEREGFLIVKAILRQQIPGSRVTYRDTTSYLNILLDDNKNKTVLPASGSMAPRSTFPFSTRTRKM